MKHPVYGIRRCAVLMAPLLLSALSVCAAQARDPLPVPDVMGFQTLKCDLHIHSVFSDGEVWPATRVLEAWRDGLDAIAITDHVGHHPHKPDISTDLRRSFDVARPEAERLGLVLIPGVEIMEGNTHFNALFVTDAMAFGGLKMLPALRAAASQKAFVFWNHPGWKEKPRWSDLVRTAYDESLFRGVELVNGLTYYPEVFPFVRERQLTILANSDVHAPIQTEYEPRTRPVTLVLAKSRDIAGIREALDTRRTAAWVAGQVWGAGEILDGLWKESIELETPSVKMANPARTAALRIRNRSAIPFQARTAKCPEWLYCGQAEIGAQRTGLISLGATKAAPSGLHRVEIELEITNLHTSSVDNLKVRLPFEVEIP